MEKRLFIGFLVSKKISKVVPLLKTTMSQKEINSFKWLSGKNIHLTISFLGNINDDMVTELISRLKKNIRQNMFEIEIQDTGAFPSNKHPNVLWLGISKGELEIIKLRKQINNSLKSISSIREEKFIPHVTIARLKKTNMKIDVSSFLNTVYSPIEFLVDSIHLYESRLTSQGAKYQSLAMFPLSKMKG